MGQSVVVEEEKEPNNTKQGTLLMMTKEGLRQPATLAMSLLVPMVVKRCLGELICSLWLSLGYAC